MSRLLIITAADDKFMPLLMGLVESLVETRKVRREELACLDVGLSARSREWLREHACHVVIPDWDASLDSALSDAKPHLRAMTARPHLPRYFPGYDTYLWMDADTWVQEAFAIDWYVRGAADGSLAVTPQLDRAYQHSNAVLKWRMARLNAYYGAEAAQLAPTSLYLNSGVFALRGDAPHWARWADAMRRGVDASGGAQCCDQTALNYAVWTDRLPVHPLPALCNWLCHLARPKFDPSTGRFHEPFLPHQPIGILHLAGNTKDLAFETRDDQGKSQRIALRFERNRKRAPK